MKTTKIRQSAKGESCTFNLSGVCNYDTETTVLCHAPHPDKGMGRKGPDTWAAYGCSSCHDFLDGRAGASTIACLTHEITTTEWFHAIRETQRRLIKKGLMPS